MMDRSKKLVLFTVLVMLFFWPMVGPAGAISAELAKKCRALAIKTHPTPTPGSKATGAEKAQRDFFQSCIAKGEKAKD